MKPFFVAAALLSGSLAHSLAAQMSARIYDDAAVSQKLLASAEDDASFLLGTGGISVAWINCSRKGACTAPLAPSVLVVMIRSTRPRTGNNVVTRGEILGNAAGPRDGTGIYAWIWYDEVQRAAENAGFTSSCDLLGYVIAHEIGHLLLGPDHHPRTIMQGNWRLRELDLVSTRQLCFSRAERDRMRMVLSARCSR